MISDFEMKELPGY